MSRPIARLLMLQHPLIWQGVDIQPPTPTSHPHEEHSRAVRQTVLRSRLLAEIAPSLIRNCHLQVTRLLSMLMNLI